MALALTALFSSFLLAVLSFDPGTFVLQTASLLGVAILAGLLPARRAVGRDPIAAMRYE